MESNFKGIAGPWEVEAESIGQLVIVSEKEQEEVAEVKAVVRSGYLLTEKEWANARLIAAAPDLLDALNYLIHLHTCEQEGISSGQPAREEWLKAYEAGVAALEKATNI